MIQVWLFRVLSGEGEPIRNPLLSVSLAFSWGPAPGRATAASPTSAAWPSWAHQYLANHRVTGTAQTHCNNTRANHQLTPASNFFHSEKKLFHSKEHDPQGPIIVRRSNPRCWETKLQNSSLVASIVSAQNCCAKRNKLKGLAFLILSYILAIA